MAEEKPKYKCTMAELYAIMELGINNLLADKTAFHARNTNYNDALITSLRGLRTTAMNLPDEDARNATHQTLGNLLPGLAETIKLDFNNLKGLIRDAWPNENPTPRYEAAGLPHYNSIGTKNWEHVPTLHASMNGFITDTGNATLLTTPGGMPAGFPTQVTDNFTAWNDVYPVFLATRETSTATAAKIKANNVLYDTCMNGFMKFGVETVFRNDVDGQKRYTFTNLKNLVSPPGSASIKVTVKTAADVMIADRDILMKTEGSAEFTIRTNLEGVASKDNVDPGVYACKIVNSDGTITNVTKEINTGVNARLVVIVPN